MAFDTADLSAFLDPDLPGHALAEVEGEQIGGLFRNAPAEAFGLVAGHAPSFLARSADVAEIIDGAIFVISGREYTAISRREETAALTRIHLAL